LNLHRAGFLAAYCTFCHAQGLVPRAYLILPVDSNAVTLTYNRQGGDIQFGGAAPIAGGQGQINMPVLSYYTTFGLLGRFANFTVSLPYAVGNFSATVKGNDASLYRSGLLDSACRFSVNLKGGPAMRLKEFLTWRQRTIIGASLAVVAPTGQYDPARLVNYSSRQLALRPEIGLSQRWGHWILDAYGAVWLFVRNRQDYPQHFVRTESPIAAVESHLSYDVKPRLWFSADGNFWTGGVTGLNGREILGTRQQNSRVGVTAAIPINKHQSFKFSYDNGAHVTYGGDYQSISVAWQYGWIARPR
jgi:hypothetical protein